MKRNNSVKVWLSIEKGAHIRLEFNSISKHHGTTLSYIDVVWWLTYQRLKFIWHYIITKICPTAAKFDVPFFHVSSSYYWQMWKIGRTVLKFSHAKCASILIMKNYICFIFYEYFLCIVLEYWAYALEFISWLDYLMYWIIHLAVEKVTGDYHCSVDFEG